MSVVVPFIFPFVFPIMFPFGVLGLHVFSMLGAWWPTRVVCWVFRLTPVILVGKDGDVEPGFLKTNAIGKVFAYSGIVPVLGYAANENGTMRGVLYSEWKPMP